MPDPKVEHHLFRINDEPERRLSNLLSRAESLLACGRRRRFLRLFRRFLLFGLFVQLAKDGQCFFLLKKTCYVVKAIMTKECF
jgi:hypothetical protein